MFAMEPPSGWRWRWNLKGFRFLTIVFATRALVESCTPEFMDFLSWLGDPVRLLGWKGYRAGLDVIGKGTILIAM